MPDNSEIFQKVRDATNIVDIIGEHVALKRAGKEFKGLCPFHEDHRPSMAVVPQKQIFHCFVCGTGGDVFKFVKEFHKMSNGEALRMLAQRAGIKLPELPSRSGNAAPSEGPSIRERIAATNEWACSFFQKMLRSPDGKPGLDYLHSRGLTDDTINKFRLGFAPESWTALCTAALRQSGTGVPQSGTGVPPVSGGGGRGGGGPSDHPPLTPDNLSNAGLIKKRSDGSPYDLFRNRVIFPIIDATGGTTGGGAGGRIIAFGGRVLVERRDDQGMVVEAKYLNTPETRLFNKSQSLFGLNFARQHIVRTRTAIIVEGYMDVIAAHQAGVANVIATLGTALTPEHTRTLKNYAQTAVLVFDSDDAGRRAADRAMDVFVHTPIDVKITSVPDGKDPCDFCMKNGGEAFQKLVDQAQDALTFKWTRLAAEVHATDSITARQDAVTEFLRFVAASLMSPSAENIDPIRRGQLLVKISSLVGMSVDEVTQTLFRLSRLRPTTGGGGPAGTGDGAGKLQAPTPDAPSRWTPDALADAESWLIGFILQSPPLYGNIREEIALDLFTKFTLQAELFIEYFENTILSDATLAGFCSFIEERENADQVTHAAILWERLSAHWIDLPGISENTAKLVTLLRQEAGHTPDKVVADCCQFLIDAAEDRMRLFKQSALLGAAADPDAALEQHFQDIRDIATRNSHNKNRRNVGYHAATPAAPTSLNDLRRIARAS
ncbi:MAG TPA: CHC2 zinc finger domain-containing protein [Phycisphaerae bacterium]|nr:CHC2 zinc finger domain-containing protein [Phycisphaerae bacterium]